MKIKVRLSAYLPLLFLSGFLWSAALFYNKTQDYRQGHLEYQRIRTESMQREKTADRGIRRGTERESAEEILKQYNSDYVFWLRIPDTPIDYPVVCNPAPDYYLNHTFQKQKNSSGCLFIQPSESESVENTIIYGHNRKDRSMFGTLKKYESSQYYVGHPTLWIYYKGRWYQEQIFSCQIKEKQDFSCYQTEFKDREDKEEFLKHMKQGSLYPIPVYPALEDPVITLSTCYGSSKRMIVQAVLMCYTE